MKHVFIISSLVLFITSAKGQDRYFARTYTSNVLPKGSIDMEFFHTSRFGHAGQFYHGQDQRMELEFGLGHNVQTAFYFNRWQERFSVSPDSTATSNEIGFSNEWKWRVSDPYVRKIGFALYGEWGIKGGDELELEGKIILDKIIGKNHIAFNGVVEYEREFQWLGNKVRHDAWKAPVEFDLAYLYNIKRDLGIGFELRDDNGISKGEGWKHSVLFGGPTIDYRGGRWFVIVNWLPQWVNLHKTDVAPGSKVLDELERTEARIIVGISL